MRVVACVLALGAVLGAASGAAARRSGCPALGGSIFFDDGAGNRHALSLAACTTRDLGRRPHAPGGTPTRIVLGRSPDRRLTVVALNSEHSASIAADGLPAEVVDRAGRRHALGTMLAYPDYLTWCGSTVVYVQGGDRIATDVKRLVAASPPSWRPRILWRDPHRSFASPTCTPSGDGVAVLTQRASTNARFFATRWQLWSVGLDGARRLLDRPPAGSADESPAWSPGGDALAFVREHDGYGTLVISYRGVSRVASLGYSLGFYGHHDWGLAWRA